MRKYKIVSKFRFTITLVLLSVILSFMFFSIIVEANEADNINTIPVAVEQGDTLWQLAKKYNNDNIDIRDYINKVLRLNNMSSASIKPGQVLYFPN